MSDSSFGLPPPPLVTPEKVRDTARAYKALAQTQTPSTERPS